MEIIINSLTEYYTPPKVEVVSLTFERVLCGSLEDVDYEEWAPS
jgi:hypothetical protein